MSTNDLQTHHEEQLARLLDTLTGKSGDSDWALVRALVHKAVHLAADRKVDFCQIAMLFSEMQTHAHSVMHPGPHIH